MSGERLRSSAARGDYRQLLVALGGGANTCAVNDEGLTALHLAVWNGHLECVEALCVYDLGKDRESNTASCINARSSAGFTALHLAAIEGLSAADVIRTLLLCGADPTIRDNLGRTAAETAREFDRDENVLHALRTQPNSLREFRETLKEKHKVHVVKSNQAAKVPPALEQTYFVPPGAREPRPPRELAMAESSILPSFEKCYAARRSAPVARSLSFLTTQGLINEKRRKELSDISLAAEVTWWHENSRAGAIERELVDPNTRKPSRRPRKYKLMPIVSLDL